MLTSLHLCLGSTWQTGKNKVNWERERRKALLVRSKNHGTGWGKCYKQDDKSYGFRLKVYRNNPSLEKVSLSSSSISSTINLLFAFFMKYMSALLRFLKQKYTTASLHKSRRSANVLRSSGKAGSKYTQSAAKITLGLSLRTSAGNGSPLISR